MQSKVEGSPLHKLLKLPKVLWQGPKIQAGPAVLEDYASQASARLMKQNNLSLNPSRTKSMARVNPRQQAQILLLLMHTLKLYNINFVCNSCRRAARNVAWNQTPSKGDGTYLSQDWWDQQRLGIRVSEVPPENFTCDTNSCNIPDCVIEQRIWSIQQGRPQLECLKMIESCVSSLPAMPLNLTCSSASTSLRPLLTTFCCICCNVGTTIGS